MQMKYLYATAAVAVIGCGVLYLKQVRASAYDRCFQSMSAGNTMKMLQQAEALNGWKTLKMIETEKGLLQEVESCANREMFR